MPIYQRAKEAGVSRIVEGHPINRIDELLPWDLAKAATVSGKRAA